MILELNIDNSHDSKVELIKSEGNIYSFKVNDKTYEADIVKVAKGIYSIVIDGKSFNIDLFHEETKKNYVLKTFWQTFYVDVIDAETRYLQNRTAGIEDQGGLVISTPIPGKVVKILVKPGDFVKEETTVIVVEAMKMQSEYKVKKDRKILEVKVKEGDTVLANQPLIIVE